MVFIHATDHNIIIRILKSDWTHSKQKTHYSLLNIMNEHVLKGLETFFHCIFYVEHFKIKIRNGLLNEGTEIDIHWLDTPAPRNVGQIDIIIRIWMENTSVHQNLFNLIRSRKNTSKIRWQIFLGYIKMGPHWFSFFLEMVNRDLWFNELSGFGNLYTVWKEHMDLHYIWKIWKTDINIFFSFSSDPITAFED